MNYNLRLIKLNKLFLFNIILILSLFFGFITANNLNNTNDAIIAEYSPLPSNSKTALDEVPDYYTNGSPNKKILNSFNLTYDNEPAGRCNIYTRDIIQLSNRSYALLISNSHLGNLYLGLSPDGWHWGNFSQLNSKEENIMRYPQLFELHNGSLGVAFVYYIFNDGGLYYRIINSTGRLGIMQPILLLPGPQLNIAANFKMITLVNGTQGLVLYSGEYSKQYLTLILAENFPFSWKDPILINPTVLPANSSFNYIFDIAVTPQDQLVFACRAWNFLTSSSFISVSTMSEDIAFFRFSLIFPKIFQFLGNYSCLY